jgi:hypothetical protein
MTTSPITSFLKEIKGGGQIPEGEKAYFRERLRNRLFNLIAGEYARQHDAGTLSQAEIARRLTKSPAQINRWLGAPGNWTLDTVSDLLLAVSAAELEIGIRPLEESPRRNRRGPDWLNVPAEGSMLTERESAESGQIVIDITKPGFQVPSPDPTSVFQVTS